METWTQRKGADRPLDVRHALGAAQAGDGEAGPVLIVDVAAPVRLVCAANLEAEGLQVLEAADGLDARAQAQPRTPGSRPRRRGDAGLDAFQLAERLRADARTRGMSVIFLSGEVGHANPLRARVLGVVAYLTKRFDPRAGRSELMAAAAS